MVNTKTEISNPEQIKCHIDPRFIIFDSPIHNPFNEYLLKKGFKVQDIHFLFSKSIPFTFFTFLSFEVPMWSTRLSHPKVTTPRKQRASETSDSRQRGAKSESNEGRYFRNSTVGHLMILSATDLG